jgi:hypothetical protein
MKKERNLLWLVRVGLAGAAALVGYVSVLRPLHLRWGATDEEFHEHLPGDEVLLNPEQEATHAITINAPVSDVWPWLVQIGQNKGGFYSYSWLENLVGCNLHNADTIVPEWQSLRVGDVVWLHPKAPPLPVIIAEPNRAIVLGGLEKVEEVNGSISIAGGTWGMYLKEIDATTTRLIVRVRWVPERGLVNWFSSYVVMEPAHFIMERKMLLSIKKRAGHLAKQRAIAKQADNVSRAHTI